MATTTLSHVIEPKEFTRYARQLTVQKSALLSSSVLVRSAEADTLAAQRGSVLEVPHFNPFTYAESDLIGTDATVNGTSANITASSQVGQKDYNAKSWATLDLVSQVIGEDVSGYIAANIVSPYWAQDIQAKALAKLKGIEAGNTANNGGDMIVNVANDSSSAVTAAQSANFNTILDTLQTMGDAMDKLGVVVMHSQVFTNLMKLEPTAFSAPSETQPFVSYYKKRVVIDDGMPVTTGTNRKTFTTYFLGQGAFLYGEADYGVGTEVWRNPAAGNNGGEERLYTRKQLLIHPQGFTSKAEITAPAKSPSQAQYQAAAAFERKFERKNVPIAILKTNA